MPKKPNNSRDRTSSGCCSGVSRRTFLAASSAAAALPVVAGPFTRMADGADGAIRHYVPADKELSPEWVASLTSRGKEKIWSGDELNTLALPIGGIGAGQMYLLGDGRLACWHIYNQTFFTGYGATNYQQKEIPGLRLEQGFRMIVRNAAGKVLASRRLDRDGFPKVGFIGRYPIGKVLYRDEALPVKVELEAFSPFIPLNTLDSTLPATILEFSLKNTSGEPMEVDLIGWLENPVGVHSTKAGVLGRVRQAVGRNAEATWIDYAGLAEQPPAQGAGRANAEVFADFEGKSYGAWTLEGRAFGQAPASGAVGDQNPITGFQGKGLVNTYNPDDDARGKLTSPTFVIRRPYINFLIGGGSNDRRVYMRLLVDGTEVRRTAGNDSETLSWRSWNVRSLRGKTAQIEIVDNATGGWGHINVDQIEFADRPRAAGGPFERQTDFGTVRLALLDQADGAAADADPEADLPAFAQRPAEAVYELGEARMGVLAKRLTLAPGQAATLPFVLAWHFPIRRWGYPEFGDVGNYYATRFPDAGAVVDYVQSNYERLCAETRLYCKTFYDQSTLPHWFLERIGSTPSILATGTVHWRKNGRFWGWEGVGCCSGTCTHVWNYEHALARLFPELERSMREMQDFGAGFSGNGLVSFRGDSYSIPQYAADGQCGTVLKAYREHLVSSDDGFLRRNYDKIKRALHYSMVCDANTRTERTGGSSTSWNTQPVVDAPFDGIITDRQHNTYDINFYGPNTMIGSLYLAALLAGEKMARAMGDADFAQLCRQIFESGRRYSAEKLFDGEYFIQETTDDNRERDFQYHRGCLSDQLFGQGWARQVGLEDVYPKEQVVSALRSIYKYNWAPDVAPQNQVFAPERWFARAGDAGLFICTWPKSPRPGGNREVRYRDEIWTGIEYQVAGNMIYEGLVKEGLSILKGLHERHDGVKHNPYNEVECGDHYARAMAGWGCLLAACGFYYDGPLGVIGFAPKFQKDRFAGFFSGAEGWGTLAQEESDGSRVCSIRPTYGKLRLCELRVSGDGVKAEGAKVTGVSGARVVREGEWIVVRFPTTTFTAGDKLEVALPPA
ncbi:hypothetical protein HS125_03050 [bacterium]|nr:hypothetical protein [bacterium]